MSPLTGGLAGISEELAQESSCHGKGSNIPSRFISKPWMARRCLEQRRKVPTLQEDMQAIPQPQARLSKNQRCKLLLSHGRHGRFLPGTLLAMATSRAWMGFAAHPATL